MTASTRLPFPLAYSPRHGNPLVTVRGRRTVVERLMQEGRR
ncbi:hypothetical protein ABT030_33010 [Streptomyces mirabilis]